MLDLEAIKESVIHDIVEARIRKVVLESATEYPYVTVCLEGFCLVPGNAIRDLIAEAERLQALTKEMADTIEFYAGQKQLPKSLQE